MPQPIKVLLVDDKEDYCLSLSGAARSKNIQIVYKLDWETGFEVLKEDPRIEFVILDGKGKIEADQETEKDNFAIRAKDDIKDYGHQIGRYIPCCLNTGFMDNFTNFEGSIKIFEKSEAHRDIMFQYIMDEVGKSDYRKARMHFNEPFASFDKDIINPNHKNLLVDIINAFINKDYRKININLQRDLLEAILISLNNPIPCIPSELFKTDGNPNHEWCSRFLEGRPTRDANSEEHRISHNIPKVIQAAFRKLKESTNELSHLPEEVEVNVKTPFLANTFLLMEILEWLPNFAQDNYPNYI